MKGTAPSITASLDAGGAANNAALPTIREHHRWFITRRGEAKSATAAFSLAPNQVVCGLRTFFVRLQMPNPQPKKGNLKCHANARLTPKGRAILVEHIGSGVDTTAPITPIGYYRSS
jgi:hypothetical protein